MKREIHKIDATGRILGRLATEIAVLLRGKLKVDFRPNMDQGDFVVVANAAGIKVTGKKLTQKKYHRFSGYPGGITTVNLKEKMEKDPSSVIRHAVLCMLPKNKLRIRMIKRLSFVKR